MSRVLSATQPLPGELASPPDHLSYSQVAKLSSRYRLSCPRQWAYSRLMGMESEPSAPMLCGTALDAGAQAFQLRRMAGGDVLEATADAIEAAKLSCRLAAWPEPAKAEGYARIVEEGLSALIATQLANVPVSVQQRHEFTVRGTDGHLITVVGYSDWILADGTIVDLKWSGSPRWNSTGEWQEDWLSEKRDQLAMYWLDRLASMKRHGGEVVPPIVPPWGEVVVVQHKLGQKTPAVRTVRIDFTTVDRERLVDLVRDADEIARSGVHPPRPGAACTFCNFVDRCRLDSARTAVPTQQLVEV